MPYEIETDTLRDAAVTVAKLATDAVETAKIKDANVTAAKLAADAVTTAKLAADAVTTAKLADDAVTGDKLAPARFRITKTAAQTITTATETKITWGTADFDSASGWDGTNNWYVIPETGLYYVRLRMQIVSAALDAMLSVERDATPNSGSDASEFSGYFSVQTTSDNEPTLEIGDYVEATADDRIYANIWHNRGSDANISGGTTPGERCALSIVRVA